MNKKKNLSEKLRSLTYMQVSLGIFAAAALLFVISLVFSIVKAGDIGMIIALPGFLAGLLSLSGIIVTLYGHFAVGLEGKVKWTLGLILNGAVFLSSLTLYIVGLFL